VISAWSTRVTYKRATLSSQSVIIISNIQETLTAALLSLAMQREDLLPNSGRSSK